MEVMSRLFGKSNPELHEVMADMALAKPSIKSSKLTPRPADPKGDAYLSEYAELATAIGIAPPDLGIESFKAFLSAHDLPVYSLAEVIAYMDDKSAKESKHQAGWEWRPLREKDNREMIFGRSCERPDGNYSPPRPGRPASDYYSGPGHFSQRWYSENGQQSGVREFDKPSAQAMYDRTIPLHAVRRIALIEREYRGSVAFFVSDYALLPEVRYPDPFLMAVIPNINVALGTGRFVIDFWDEPGFGIDKMLK